MMNPMISEKYTGTSRLDELTGVAESVNDSQLPGLLESAQQRFYASDDLESAFSLFSQLSEQLSGSYHGLEQQIEHLNCELSLVKAERAEELHEKQRVTHRLESLLHLLPGGVIVLDQHGAVRDCNPAAIDLLGEPLLGSLWIDVIQRSFSPRSDDGHEISLKDGRRISIATRSLDDVEPGQLILLTDQTETRNLQHQLSRHERLSAMGRMMSSLAHQIRTPLSAALLYAGHLTEGNLTPAQSAKFSQKVVARLMHLEQTVKEMLLFVKGDVKLTEIVSLEHLMEDLRAAVDLIAQQYRISVSLDYSQGEQSLLCNLETIVSALSNLVENALQASPVGSRVTINASINEQGNIQIQVSDQGAGMDEATLSQVQDAFFTTKPQGTGLGLSVVKAVAQAHQGDFFIHSTVGKGTVAGIELPAMSRDTQVKGE
jgi:two-component system sensor histidine kinase FlrB